MTIARKLFGIAAVLGTAAPGVAQIPVRTAPAGQTNRINLPPSPWMTAPRPAAPGTPAGTTSPPPGSVYQTRTPEVSEVRQTGANETTAVVPNPMPRAVAPSVPAIPPVQAVPPVAPRALPPAQPAAVPATLPLSIPAGRTSAPTAPIVPPPAPAPAPAAPAPTDGACGTAACDPACGPAGQTWVRGEWLFWVTSGQPLPPLVTTAPANTPRAAAGILGQPGTLTQFGGRRTNNDFRNGFRLTAGTWLDDDRAFGLEGDFFFLGRSRQGFAASSAGTDVIARPFFDPLANAPVAELVSFPGVLAGSVVADSRSNAIGGGLNALCNLCCDPCGRVDWVLGYRYFQLRDELTITEDLTALTGQTRVPAGSRYLITDRFKTTNDFHGAVVGLSGERRSGNFFYGGKATVALGGVSQRTEISGQTTIIPPAPGVPQTLPGGLLAQPSNIGTYTTDRFAVMPEVGVRAGVYLTDHARVYAGYNFVYLSSVARAGDQIDLRVNPNQLPPANGLGGPGLPAFPDKTTDFWLQGVTIGVELRY